MNRSAEFSQLVARAVNHTTWNIPRIRDGTVWRNIKNSHLVENHEYLNGHDRYEDSIFRTKRIMEKHGWNTDISDMKEQCHEHLHYKHFRLRCWK